MLRITGGDSQVTISTPPKDYVPICTVDANHVTGVINSVRESTGVSTERAAAELHNEVGVMHTSASTGALAEKAHAEPRTKGGDTQMAISALPKDSVPTGAVGVSHTTKVVDGACESIGVFTERTTAELHIKGGAVQVTASTGGGGARREGPRGVAYHGR